MPDLLGQIAITRGDYRALPSSTATTLYERHGSTPVFDRSIWTSSRLRASPRRNKNVPPANCDLVDEFCDVTLAERCPLASSEATRDPAAVLPQPRARGIDRSRLQFREAHPFETRFERSSFRTYAGVLVRADWPGASGEAVITVGPLVATGRTSDVYAYGDGSVVKVPRPDVPPHWAEKEAEFTAAVRRLGAPAPEVRGLVRIEGREAIVFERVDGESMWQRMLDSVDDLPALAREFADIHRAILSAGLPTDVIGSVERMCTKLSEASQLTVADRVEAQELARSLPHGAALLHGDLHPGNVLIGGNGPVVIDWFDASIGHPITDVVRTSLLIRSDGAGSPLHLPGARPDLLGRLLEVYVEAVLRHLGGIR